MEVGQIANEPAKPAGFVGEFVGERAAKPKEGLGKKRTRALSNKSSSYAGYGFHDTHPVLCRLLLFPGIRAITFAEYNISFFTFLISEVLWKLMT